MDELTLTNRISLRDPADLPSSNRVHRLVTLDRSTRAFDRSESEAGGDALFNESVILLDDVVDIRRCPTTTAPTQFAGLLQFGDRTGVRQMSIDIDTRREG